MKEEFHYGSIIKQYLDEKGISVGKLAKKMSCAPRTIYYLFDKNRLTRRLWNVYQWL
jgi:plasmid maintenance system antidote protein VapI